ncbi:MAG: succinate dehydrogenase, partial [Blautia sp.]|nr:succinate dehydrogenase [Blautia sp.]
DLWVDRTILRENLKELGLTANGDFAFTDRNNDIAFEASKCLQCGCCLEVCPNYVPGGKFFGAAGYAPETKFLTALSVEEAKNLRPAYMTHIYSGCGKSLACKDICPAGLDMDHLLSRSNAVTVWKRKK